MIVISSGHSKYCRGASGILDEVDEARKIVERVADHLQAIGFGVITFHDDVSTSQSENLDRIVAFHNSQTRDLDVSIHLNCYDGSAHGTECLYVTQEDLADQISAAIAEAGGFTNRGPKKRTDLAFLNNTDEPAILIEVCFVDSQIDADLYRDNFDDICRAIAGVLSDEEVPPIEPEAPELPILPRPPEDVPLEDRPTLRIGDSGPDVVDLQALLPRACFGGAFDGDFGPITEDGVLRYQLSRGLDVDGICGQQTWGALYENKPPVPLPEPPPDPLSPRDRQVIMDIANRSAIAGYAWEDRGEAPRGYTQGMALAFAQTLLKLRQGHPAAIEMAKARTNSDKDALNVYRDDFDELGMSNEDAGADTLRHLYALMLGHFVRESSGRHCEGRDMSASNVESETAEAGLAQTSYNAAGASYPQFDRLMDEYAARRSPGYLAAFAEDVSCSSDDWSCYGSGRGAQFQLLCKVMPAFAVESAGLTLRNLANHYGPVVRHEVELKLDANEMFQAIQDYVERLEFEGA